VKERLARREWRLLDNRQAISSRTRCCREGRRMDGKATERTMCGNIMGRAMWLKARDSRQDCCWCSCVCVVAFKLYILAQRILSLPMCKAVGQVRSAATVRVTACLCPRRMYMYTV
jgi:hypothetical protein